MAPAFPLPLKKRRIYASQLLLVERDNIQTTCNMQNKVNQDLLTDLTVACKDQNRTDLVGEQRIQTGRKYLGGLQHKSLQEVQDDFPSWVLPGAQFCLVEV